MLQKEKIGANLMFYKNYLDDYYYEQLINNYDINYLKNLDEDNFKRVYDIFIKYNFYFVEDIIENYLELFELDSSFIENKIKQLALELGPNYVYIIGDDLSLLNKLEND